MESDDPAIFFCIHNSTEISFCAHKMLPDVATNELHLLIVFAWEIITFSFSLNGVSAHEEQSYKFKARVKRHVKQIQKILDDEQKDDI